MGEEDSGAGFIHDGGHRIRDNIDIKRPGIWSHLTKILIQCFFVVRELNAFKILWPDANTELIEPHLLIWFRRNSTFYRRAPGAAPAWLIDKIGGEPATQEYVLETFTTIRRAFPSAGELACTVQHDDRVFMRILRNLVEHGGMIAMIGLASRIQRFFASNVPGVVMIVPPAEKLPCS